MVVSKDKGRNQLEATENKSGINCIVQNISLDVKNKQTIFSQQIR